MFRLQHDSHDQEQASDYKAMQKRIESGHIFLHNVVNGVTNKVYECKNQMQPCRFTGDPWMMRFDEEDGKWWEMGKIVGYNDEGILISAVFSTTEGATHIIKWEDIKWISQ